ncbi:XRE family transcriptional regulator [Rubritalea tangerina]|uniref:XRE family transcriptional regulator n=1 Tax=Rubritalea tangerina TaxID=430798 RepID=A0ABW4ZD92_9BACT
MNKQLNIEAIKEAAKNAGFNQSQIAEKLDISRAAVSKWFKAQTTPRPAELLKLGKLLGLRHKDLYLQAPNPNAPLVAFRKRASTKTTDKHIERAKLMGLFLQPLVQYFDFDPYLAAPALKSPSLDYKYIQGLVSQIRTDLEIKADAPVDFQQLIGLFAKYQAKLIPTLWGEKSKHENALHIYLPDSQTTWVYLNLDTNIHDFKFWMAHELGHVMSISLLESGDVDFAEDFADTFAGALLYPATVAAGSYIRYRDAKTESARLKVLVAEAREFVISPLSVYKELEKYAEANGQPFKTIEQGKLHASISRFNQGFKNLSHALLETEQPTAEAYFELVKNAFGSDFFDGLQKYLNDTGASLTSLCNILNVSPVDAKAYHEALSH